MAAERLRSRRVARGDPRHRRRRHVHGRGAARRRRVADGEGADRAEQEESVVAAAQAVGAPRVERFTHGTTIATNALLERKGARTAFVATEGFEHLLHLRRQTRAHLYRLCDAASRAARPARALSRRPRADRAGRRPRAARPRLAARGRRRGGRRLPALRRSAIPPTRRRWPTSCGGGCPAAHVVASHEVAPEFREYERASTTAADAYLGPACGRYFRALASRRAGGGPARAARHALVRRRGDARRKAAAAHPALVLVSGPAGGVVGAGLGAGAGGDRERDLVRHGRHVDGRLPDRGRPRRADRSSGSSAASRSGCRWSTSTRSAPAAARSSGATPAARSASGRRARARTRARPATGAAARGRPSPTPTCCSGGCRRRSRAGSSSTATRRSGRMAGIDPATWSRS